MTILIVEDERIIALDLRQKLRKLGYDVPGMAHNGRDAVRMAEDLNPDLVLMDIILEGDMDGIDAARIIRERCNMPVVFVSACNDMPTRTRAMHASPCGFISKPVETGELKTCIESIFSLPR